jgi:ribosomal protein S16
VQYIVRQGDHLARIATAFGFSEWKKIWDHAANAALRAKRRNPDVLMPGDEVFIPERGAEKTVTRPTDTRSRFVVRRPPLQLALVLERSYGPPLANARCGLWIDGSTESPNTDAEGRLNQRIRPTANALRLLAKDSGSALDGQSIELRVGHLDPVEEPSGQRARLDNLGYRASTTETADSAQRERAMRSAIEEFQCDEKLLVDGICGRVTQALLLQVHGS